MKGILEDVRIGVMGISWDTGKQNGNYYLGFRMGGKEKTMETTSRTPRNMESYFVLGLQYY